ncbi:hypothetical protein KIN20_013857 [Parelaphostrongylus tenuis]|uniref:Uncharacterized protein n=1 Tax=Parelaphostrongylus tenuis TaxID=148309 RepID=A0AAD5N2I9_PARTN|nr:hypothetical protein KIN20_013857 [Parelaphostrongylus tenuis]
MKKKEVDPAAEEAVEKASMDSTSSPKLESAQSFDVVDVGTLVVEISRVLSKHRASSKEEMSGI